MSEKLNIKIKPFECLESEQDVIDDITLNLIHKLGRKGLETVINEDCE